MEDYLQMRLKLKLYNVEIIPSLGRCFCIQRSDLENNVPNVEIIYRTAKPEVCIQSPQLII